MNKPNNSTNMNQEYTPSDMLENIYRAICAGQEVFHCSRGAFTLPSPQRTGTGVQQHTYNFQKAREVFAEIIRTK